MEISEEERSCSGDRPSTGEKPHKEKRSVLDREKAQNLNKEIGEASGKKSLFKIVDSFLIKNPGLKLLWHASLPELVERFSATLLPKSPTSVPG